MARSESEPVIDPELVGSLRLDNDAPVRRPRTRGVQPPGVERSRASRPLSRAGYQAPCSVTLIRIVLGVDRGLQ